MSVLTQQQLEAIRDDAPRFSPSDWPDITAEMSENEATIVKEPLTGSGSSFGATQIGQWLESADQEDMDWLNENQIIITVNQGGSPI